jgi:phosphoribosylformylglycinamidine (FGAM) synthase-like amidotransferase family enzyme
MAQRTLSVRKNADETVTIKANNYVESVDISVKSVFEKYEAVRWAIITAGFSYTDEIDNLVIKELYS